MGSSLHGLITALSFGKSAALVASPTALVSMIKFKGFLSQFDIQQDLVLFTSWARLLAKLGKVLAYKPNSVSDSAKPLLQQHWTAIRQCFAKGVARPLQVAELKEWLATESPGELHESLAPALQNFLQSLELND
jgi:hypothetical protein